MDDPRDLPGDVAFRGHRIEVRRVRVHRRGREVTRDLVVHGGSVCVLGRLDDGSVVLIRNHRYAAGGWLWELPAGTLEPGEDPAACALRELREETGYEAARVEPLGTFLVSPGYCTEVMHAFRATGLRAVGQDLDDAEEIEVEAVPPARLDAMVAAGDVRDGKTLATLLLDRSR